MAEFKPNRKHMTASNLYPFKGTNTGKLGEKEQGSALVNDYGKAYQPSYMKAIQTPKPGNRSAGADKLYNNNSVSGASKLGNVIPVTKEKTVYQDSKPNKSNAPKPDYKASVKKDKKKKERMKLGRNTHKAAQQLMGGKR